MVLGRRDRHHELNPVIQARRWRSLYLQLHALRLINLRSILFSAVLQESLNQRRTQTTHSFLKQSLCPLLDRQTALPDCRRFLPENLRLQSQLSRLLYLLHLHDTQRCFSLQQLLLWEHLVLLHLSTHNPPPQMCSPL